MTLNATELAAVCAEAETALMGRSVQKVVQTGPATVIVGWKGVWLLLSADARSGRLHLLDGKPPGSGEAATAFCMLLRKELVGARLVACRAIEGERAAELRFLRREGDGETFADVPRSLRLYLFGRAGQLSIHDADGVLLGRIGPAQRPHLELPPPRIADPPPLVAGLPPHDGGAPSPRVAELPTRNGEQRADAAPTANRFTGDGLLSPRIAAHYEGLEDREAAAAAHAEAQAQLQKVEARLRRKRDALAGDLGRASATDEIRRRADLILASLGTLGVVARGTPTITVPDVFGDGSPVEIALDPTRTPQEHAGRLYKQVKRLGQAKKAIAVRLAQVEAELTAVSDSLAGRTPLAPSLRQKISADAGRRQQKGAHHDERRAAPYHEFRSESGAVILVGRGADRNDELTFQVARGADLWLHTRDVAGAHVIVVLDGKPVDEQTLLDAATLAAHHSQARDERQVDVGYTLRKHVRRPPKARPGQVTTSALKTLRVRLEPQRLQRLLESRR